MVARRGGNAGESLGGAAVAGSPAPRPAGPPAPRQPRPQPSPNSAARAAESGNDGRKAAPQSRLVFAVLLGVAATGCASLRPPDDRVPPAGKAAAPSPRTRVETLSPASGVGSEETPGELHTLSAYEVREAALSDFGMSVKTNFGVQWGDNVEWMLVTAVAAGSSAAGAGLKPGDRILAIDGRLVAELSRDGMLAALFHRRKGETARVLVLGRGQALPRFVTLTASRP